jgi:hypothetical protein
MIEANECKKNSKEMQYNVYNRNAGLKNLEFSITFEEYSEIVTKECHYCGITQERGFNGIDRKDQTKGYIIDNCTSCCKMCNYMKGSTSDEVFIKRAEHILTFQGRINGKLYPECFADHKSSLYVQYRNRAIKKQLDFLIMPDDYNNIIKHDCYLCGKKNSNSHNNGIDRLNNNIGYILSNVISCCCECNYMKKNYSYEDLFLKINLIHEKHKNDYRYELVETNEDINSLVNFLTINDNNTYTQQICDELDAKNIDSIEGNRIKQRTYRERMICEHGIECVREKQKEKMATLRSANKNIEKNKNKKTDEDKKESARLRKQKQREIMKEKYGNEEYKKMRAKEIADNRKKNKQ